MSFQYSYQYKAQVACANGKIREMSGVAVGTDNVKLLRVEYTDLPTA